YSSIMQVNETALYAELNRLRDKNKNGNNKHNILNSKKTELELKKGEVIAEIYLLNICIYYFKKAKNIFELLNPADFSNDIHSKIAGIIQKAAIEDKKLTAGEIIGFFENEEEKSRVAEVFSQKLPEVDVDSLIKSSLDKVINSKSDRTIHKMIEKMDEVYQAGEIDSANRIFVEIKELQKKKR
ncbi:MAG TPA: hypothetical protein VEF53_04375, partial [Patescibacteria group bacterium]|nr:hypothetical protein [Patescibacteria group bacterium]